MTHYPTDLTEKTVACYKKYFKAASEESKTFA